jgi:hypothetical protein
MAVGLESRKRASTAVARSMNEIPLFGLATAVLSDRLWGVSRPTAFRLQTGDWFARLRGALAALWGVIWAKDVRRRLIRSPKVNGTVSGTEISFTEKNPEKSVR